VRSQVEGYSALKGRQGAADLGLMAVYPADDPLALARHYLQTGNAKRALAELEKAPGSVDDDEFWYLRAHSLFELGNWDEAAQAAQAGLEREADDVELLDILALAELERGREKEARKAIDAALELCPDLAELHAHRALILARRKPKSFRVASFREARASVDEALRLDPHSEVALRVRAQVALLSGDTRHADEYADEVLAAEPDDEFSHLVRGSVHADRADFKRAMRHFEEAARLNPESPDAGEALREARVGAHPLLAIVRPVWRFGRMRSWLVYLAVISVLALARLPSVRYVVIGIWLTMIVLSWTVPPLLRRYYDRKRRGF
jgi:tetratricopeptide (TPR) repeat protein